MVGEESEVMRAATWTLRLMDERTGENTEEVL